MMNRRKVLGAALATVMSGALSRNALAAPSSPARSRHALVIGNARYALPGNVLANPVNDAGLVADTLGKRGFEVARLTDLTTAQMLRALDEFAVRAQNADLAMLYFAGHAVAVDDVNYLFGVDLSVPLADVRISTAQQQALSMKRVSQTLRRATIRARLVVLDACRSNLTRGAAPPSLARAIPAGGELIAYSTQPGATAEDGFGQQGPRHSPYAYYFAQRLNALPGDAALENFFKQLTGDVQIATAYRQIPHYASSLVGTVTLGSLTDADTVAAPGAGGSAGRGAPALGRDLIKSRMNAWEYEIERGAAFLDVPRLESFKARAKAGDVVAQTTLGLIYDNGNHVPRDAAAAARRYRAAADKDFAPAQTYLGELVGMGKGVAKDFGEAERLFRAAAEAGHQRAAMDLFDLRMRMGEPVDPMELARMMTESLRNSPLDAAVMQQGLPFRLPPGSAEIPWPMPNGR